MEIRLAQLSDALAMLETRRRAILGLVGAGFYTEVQLEFWAKPRTEASLKEMIGSTTTFVAVIEDGVVGFANLISPSGEVDQ
ncbi:MAG: hypothetical protein ACREP9_00565, partial [Candidatus Dormibacteraceae bacterium]